MVPVLQPPASLLDTANTWTALQTFKDTTFKIIDDAAPTKAFIFQASSITAGQTRTLTVPDASLIFAGSASALTSGRVPYVTTGGLLTDAAMLTVSGQSLLVGDSTGSAVLSIRSAAASLAYIRSYQNGVLRWENGSATSIDWIVRAYDSGGSLVDTPVSVANAAGGTITLARPVSCSSTLTSTGLFTASNQILNDRTGGEASVSIKADDAQQASVYFYNRTGAGLAIYRPASATSLSFYGSAAAAVVASLSNSTIAAGNFTINYTTASTTTATGALVVSGGVGVAGAIYGGGALNIASSATVSGGIISNRTTTDAGNLSTLSTTNAYSTSSNVTGYARGIESTITTAIGNGFTNSGYTRAAYLGALRNYNVDGDAGTLASAFGLSIDVGHYDRQAITPATSAIRGILISLYAKTGSISALTGIDIPAMVTGGTATVVYAIRSQLASGSGRYNLYCDGTAGNYMAGVLGVGGANQAGQVLSVGYTNPLTQTSQVGVGIGFAATTAATSGVYGVYSGITLAAGTWSTSVVTSFYSSALTVPVNVTVTAGYGLYVADPSVSGTMTNYYAVRTFVTAASGRWNIYAGGTAINHMAGNLLIGTTTDGMTSGGSLRLAKELAFDAVTAPTTAGSISRETNQSKPYIYDNGIGGWIEKCIYSQYAAVTQSGVVTSQSLASGTARGTRTLPANFFKQGKVLKFRLCGRYTTDAAPGNATVDIKIGSTTFRTTGSFSMDNSSTDQPWEISGEITCYTTGATGTVEGISWWAHGITGATGNFNIEPMAGSGTVTIDTTASQTFDVQWTATDAGTSITCTCFRLWEVC